MLLNDEEDSRLINRLESENSQLRKQVSLVPVLCRDICPYYIIQCNCWWSW